MADETTYIMIKPDGVQRGLVSSIIARFEKRGYQLIALKMVQPTRALAEKHYEDLSLRPFYGDLCAFLSSAPVVAMVWKGMDVVKQGRAMIGATDPLKSAPGTIRGDFAIVTGKNIIHGSDSTESAAREIGLWFPDAADICPYKKVANPWIYE